MWTVIGIRDVHSYGLVDVFAPWCQFVRFQQNCEEC